MNSANEFFHILFNTISKLAFLWIVYFFIHICIIYLPWDLIEEWSFTLRSFLPFANSNFLLSFWKAFQIQLWSLSRYQNDLSYGIRHSKGFFDFLIRISIRVTHGFLRYVRELFVILFIYHWITKHTGKKKKQISLNPFLIPLFFS